MKLSYVNVLDAVPVTCDHEDAAWPATNARDPRRRWLPTRSTVATATRWVFDLQGLTTPISPALVGLVRANFTACRVQLNDTNAWGGTLLYDALLAVTLNRFNRQYQHCHVITTVPAGADWLSLLVPTQTPVSESPLVAAESVFRYGGLWVGAITEAPKKFGVDFAHKVIRPFEDRKPPGEAWEEREILGNPRVEITAERSAQFTHATPYLSTDDAALWQDIDAACWDADAVYLFEDLGNPAFGWVARQTFAATDFVPDPQWPGVVKSTWGLREAVR